MGDVLQSSAGFISFLSGASWSHDSHGYEKEEKIVRVSYASSDYILRGLSLDHVIGTSGIDHETPL